MVIWPRHINLLQLRKPSVSHLYVFFCPCVVRRANSYVDKKMLNMHHQAQKGFRGIFVWIPKHQNGYLVYVPSSRKIISPYDVVSYESFSCALAYTSRPYSEAMVMRPAVAYTPCSTSSRGETGNIITFTLFEEGGILTKTCNDANSGDNDSIMPLLMSR